jgi:hypothetical protein
VRGSSRPSEAREPAQPASRVEVGAQGQGARGADRVARLVAAHDADDAQPSGVRAHEAQPHVAASEHHDRPPAEPPRQ